MNDREFGLFPMFVDISTKKVVVIGAGKIASRRIQTLTEFAPEVTVVADRVSESVERLASQKRILLHRRRYERDDLYGADIVIAATDDHPLNDEIYSVCKCLGIMVNVSTDQNKCDFHFPGIVKKEPLVIGINAGGKDHALARRTREKIETILGGEEAEC